MSPMPRDPSWEGTPGLLRDGYVFISRRCHRLRTDVFQTRLMLLSGSLQPVICMRGEAAARLFYDDDRFERRGAVSPRVLKTLFGEDGVQTLDGEAHRWRKQLFMSLMSEEGIQRLVDVARDEWRAAAERWSRVAEVTLFPQVQRLLCRSVCRWTGVPLAEDEAARRTADFAAMIDAPAAVGPRHWRGRLARRRADRWIQGVIERVRAQGQAQSQSAGGESALHAIAWHRAQSGELLDSHVAAVELINVLRPTVAVARYVAFAAVALHEFPECRLRLNSGDESYPDRFVQEVRRYYPFFPFVGARVRREFSWNNYRFPPGRLVLLDLYGTNHDARLWETPQAFQPERFRQREIGPFDLIPQGGGDHYANHRCPGEGITIALMKAAAEFLTTSIRYDVPPQDLHIDLARLPAIPRSRFVVSNVRPV